MEERVGNYLPQVSSLRILGDMNKPKYVPMLNNFEVDAQNDMIKNVKFKLPENYNLKVDRRYSVI